MLRPNVSSGISMLREIGVAEHGAMESVNNAPFGGTSTIREFVLPSMTTVELGTLQESASSVIQAMLCRTEPVSETHSNLDLHKMISVQSGQVESV